MKKNWYAADGQVFDSEEECKKYEDNEFLKSLEGLEITRIMDELEIFLEQLPALQKKVLKMRFGTNGRALLLSEIAQELDISRDRARSLELIGLRSLKDLRVAMKDVEFVRKGSDSYVDKKTESVEYKIGDNWIIDLLGVIFCILFFGTVFFGFIALLFS